MEGYYSVKQAAEVLRVSTKTVRNRISNGELTAIWEERGKGMSQWQIPIAVVEAAASTTLEAIPTTRQVSIEEVGRIVKGAVQDAVQEVVRGELERFKEELEERVEARDRKLLEVIRTVQEERRERPKGIWSRLFG